jgi:HEAT repeat protein
MDQMAQTLASLAAPSPAQEAPAEPRAAEAKPNSPPAPKPNAPGGPLWEKWLADLASPDSGTRWQAVQSLGGTHDPLVVPHIVPMLEDTDIFVRMASCRHLGDLGSVEAIPALIDTLEDEEASVREAAIVALRTLSGQAIPFDPGARDGERAKRVKAWRDWWEDAAKDLIGKNKAKSKA